MRRRKFLTTALAGGAILASPTVVRSQTQRVLRFVPQADLAGLDPVWSGADIIRNYSMAVFDTLYGEDANFMPQPQMVAGHTIENDGKVWQLTLRDGLKFHDGSPVLARDCIASIRRFSKRDTLGSMMVSRVDEMTALSDKVIRIRLKRPFPLLSLALAQYACAIMPERLSSTDALVQLKESVGSGPFRFKPDERIAGARVVFEKFQDYVPRADGTPSSNAGPKTVHFDRVEWIVMPDTATAQAALLRKEVDWWENPPLDVVPSLRRSKDLVIRVTDTTGLLANMRFNFLNPPFDNPAIRKVVLSALSQRDVMQAVGGEEPSLIRTNVGLFVPGSAMASDVGLSAMQDEPDLEKARRDLIASGYKGERIVALRGSNFPTIWAEAQVVTDRLKRIGMNVDVQALDWATVVQRRLSTEPIDKGGWSVMFTFFSGTGNVTPATNNPIRGTGRAGGRYGWASDERIEQLREDWFNAPDLASQKLIARQMQAQFWEFVPYVPLGVYYAPTAYQSYLQDVREGFPQFYGVRRA